MRIVVCSPGLPHKERGASAVLFWHYIQAISSETGAEILNLILLDDRGRHNHDELASYKQEMTTAAGFHVESLPAEGAIKHGSVRIHLNPQVLQTASQHIARFDPDVLVGFDILSAWILKSAADVPLIAWLGDLNFQTHWHRAAYGLREALISKVNATWVFPLVLAKCAAWYVVYRRVLRGASSVVASSGSSVDWLKRIGVTARYDPYPWPKTKSKESVVPLPVKPTFAFFGNLEALGSRSGLHFLCDDIYPEALRRWGPGGFEIQLAGFGGLPAWAAAKLAPRPEIVYVGFVEDLIAFLRGCHAMLAPIDVPVGNRSRIVTAMAERCLVIAHRSASLGNPGLKHRQTCLLARSAEEFVEAMDFSVNGRAAVTRIVDGAEHFYLTTFAPSVAVQGLVCDVRQAAERKSSG